VTPEERAALRKLRLGRRILMNLVVQREHNYRSRLASLEAENVRLRRRLRSLARELWVRRTGCDPVPSEEP